jgi:hypothetical protein
MHSFSVWPRRTAQYCSPPWRAPAAAFVLNLIRRVLRYKFTPKGSLIVLSGTQTPSRGNFLSSHRNHYSA